MKCPECGSKNMKYNSDAGPIVGGVGTMLHPPNAHPVGKWICLDCQEREIEEEQRKKAHLKPLSKSGINDCIGKPYDEVKTKLVFGGAINGKGIVVSVVVPSEYEANKHGYRIVN